MEKYIKPVLILASILLVLGAGIGVCSAGGMMMTGPYGGVDHTRKFTAYAGPATCLKCHTTSKAGSILAKDVFNSVHFQLRTASSFIDMPGKGSHGMADRACGLPGASMMANNYAGTAVTLTGGLVDDGCGKCHIAFKAPYYYPDYTSAKNDLDCLRCHAALYGDEWDNPTLTGLYKAPYNANRSRQLRKVVTLADGNKTWSQDRSLKTAQSVGAPSSARQCLRCHANNFQVKRGTVYDAAHDVHAAAGGECRDCHTTLRHGIARGNFVSDGVGNDLPSVELDCATACHGPDPHSASASKGILIRHTAKDLACETCHVPAMDTENVSARRAWGPFTLDPVSGQWEETPLSVAGGVYGAYNENYPVGAAPVIRWFDGYASMLAQPSGSFLARRSAGGDSVLFPFKHFVSGMLFDAAWLSSPPPADPVQGTRAFSMKDFYEKNWAQFLKLGFVDKAFPTAAAYWTARPDMAQMLNNFPMMLSFDRAVYTSKAGLDGVSTPLPGPQSRDTYPGIAEAIDSGLGRIGIDMGYCPTGTPLVECGKNLWSGEFFGMWVPMDMEGQLGSKVTQSHAIKRPATDCASCHLTGGTHGETTNECASQGVPEGKRVDFAALGFPISDTLGHNDPKCDVQPRPSVPWAGDIGMAFSGTSSRQTLTITVPVVGYGTTTPIAGVLVHGTLVGPAGNASLPQTLTGTTDVNGTVVFTAIKGKCTCGSYTFTVDSLVASEVTYQSHVSKTIGR